MCDGKSGSFGISAGALVPPNCKTCVSRAEKMAGVTRDEARGMAKEDIAAELRDALGDSGSLHAVFFEDASGDLLRDSRRLREAADVAPALFAPENRPVFLLATTDGPEEAVEAALAAASGRGFHVPSAEKPTPPFAARRVEPVAPEAALVFPELLVALPEAKPAP